MVAILFGAALRLMPGLSTHFPPNDGGMFYDMTRELKANHYVLPQTTDYNQLHLPYAYPPFGFYLTSLLADLTRVPLLDLFLWLPAFFSILCIPAFYYLARVLLADRLRASLAALFFALAPGEYGWLVMGGGITRAPGYFFFLLALALVYKLFQSGEKKWLAPAILTGAGAVLSHPVTGIITAGYCLLVLLLLVRTQRGLLHAALLAIGTALLTAPWWVTLLSYHGVAPLLSALSTGQGSGLSWTSTLWSIFMGGEFLPILLVLRLCGLVYAIQKRNLTLLAIFLLPLVLDPRSSPYISLLATSLFPSIGLLDALPAWFNRQREPRPLLESRSGPLIVMSLAFILFLECGLRNYTLINTSLTPGERDVMTEVRAQIPPGQGFLLISGTEYSMSDPLQEWFPTLSAKHSQTTLQGLEWTLGSHFMERLHALPALQACEDFACVQSWSERTGLDYGFIWLSIPTFESDPFQSRRANDLYESIRTSGQFSIALERSLPSERIIIFRRIHR
jgi:hypothetical protein